MTMTEFRKLVHSFGGWIEGGAAYFPSVDLHRQCEAAMKKRAEGAA